MKFLKTCDFGDALKEVKDVSLTKVMRNPTWGDGCYIRLMVPSSLDVNESYLELVTPNGNIPYIFSYFEMLFAGWYVYDISDGDTNIPDDEKDVMYTDEELNEEEELEDELDEADDAELDEEDAEEELEDELDEADDAELDEEDAEEELEDELDEADDAEPAGEMTLGHESGIGKPIMMDFDYALAALIRHHCNYQNSIFYIRRDGWENPDHMVTVADARDNGRIFKFVDENQKDIVIDREEQNHDDWYLVEKK